MRQSAGQLEPGNAGGSFQGELIITPDCLGDFISYLDGIYLGDYAIITGSSPWKERLGQELVSPLFTLRSEPDGPGVELGYAYTGDGFRAENCPIIERGALRNFTIGFYASNKSGKPRCPSGGGAPVVEAGDTPLSDMIASVKRGLLLARFSGGSPSENGDFSGVAKNSYLIEDGRIIRPVGETMITGNVARLFESIRAVSRERVDYGTAVYPWVLAGGVGIAGE